MWLLMYIEKEYEISFIYIVENFGQIADWTILGTWVAFVILVFQSTTNFYIFFLLEFDPMAVFRNFYPIWLFVISYS